MSIETPSSITMERLCLNDRIVTIQQDFQKPHFESERSALRAELATHKTRLTELQIQELAFFRAHREKLEEEVAALRARVG